MKIVINRCFGGFSLSEAAYKELGIEWDGYGYLDNKDLGIPEDAPELQYRSHPRLIEVVERLGDTAGRNATLKVVEIPDDVEWVLDDYDGNEEIHEKHRVWK